jgi:4-hydroxy-tetrahydrodipicolinate reductase
MLRIAIHGAAGRMGQRLVALAAADKELKIVAAVDAPGQPRLGEDAGVVAGVKAVGVPLTDHLDAAADVVIDFSLPPAAEKIVELCRKMKMPLVLATTGFDGPQNAKIKAAAAEIPLLRSPNMSLAVNLTMKLTDLAARALRDRDADVEILERHHRFKEDAPSGTALKFGEIVAAAMGQTEHRHGRQGRPGKRPHGEIGYHAVRAGDNPGEHAIVFGMLGETIELCVRATNRDCYAAGALAAAKFLVGRPAGSYGMDDVLGLSDSGPLFSPERHIHV